MKKLAVICCPLLFVSSCVVDNRVTSVCFEHSDMEQWMLDAFSACIDVQSTIANPFWIQRIGMPQGCIENSCSVIIEILPDRYEYHIGMDPNQSDHIVDLGRCSVHKESHEILQASYFPNPEEVYGKEIKLLDSYSPVRWKQEVGEIWVWYRFPLRAFYDESPCQEDHESRNSF